MLPAFARCESGEFCILQCCMQFEAFLQKDRFEDYKLQIRHPQSGTNATVIAVDVAAAAADRAVAEDVSRGATAVARGPQPPPAVTLSIRTSATSLCVFRRLAPARLIVFEKALCFIDAQKEYFIARRLAAWRIVFRVVRVLIDDLNDPALPV